MPYQKKLTDGAIQEAAVLVVHENLSQLDAGKLLGLSAATVNRALKIAEKRGWLIKTLECRVDPQVLRNARARVGGKLEERLRTLDTTGNFQSLRVYSSSPPPTSPSSRSSSASSPSSSTSSLPLFEAHLHQFFLHAVSFAADRLLDPKVSTVGVTWGITLEYLAKALAERIHGAPRSGNPIKCYPTCGTPPDAELNLGRSPSHLATSMNTIFNGENTNDLAFSVGAWIPAQFTPAEMKIIRRYFETKRAFAQVFGEKGKRGLIEHTDCLLTSVGPSGEFAGPWLNDAADAGKIKPSELLDMTVGNIMGCFLPTPQLSAKHLRIVERINQRWTGITLAQLNHCARVAPKRDMPGVMAFAIGHGKAQLIVESLKLGLINCLIVDSELAEGLGEMVPEVSSGPSKHDTPS